MDKQTFDRAAFFSGIPGPGLHEVYVREVLPVPTRRVVLPGKACNGRIVQSLFGIELQLAGRRQSCPDMVTARFLLVFGSLGAPSIRVPFNPKTTERVLPELERAFLRLNDAIEQAISHERSRDLHRVIRRRVYGRVVKLVLKGEASFLPEPCVPPSEADPSTGGLFPKGEGR